MDKGYYYQEHINVEGAKTFLKNVDLEETYIAIMDTGINEGYWKHSLDNGSITGIHRIDSYEEFTPIGAHGTKVQILTDELLVKLEAQNVIKTLHFKYAEFDEEKDVVRRFCNMVDEVIKYKTGEYFNKTYNIRVLNFSQSIKGVSEDEVEKVKEAVKKLAQHNISIVSCACNTILENNIEKSISDNTIMADIDKVITVGATNRINERWISDIEGKGSATGKQIDIVAPGENIRLGDQIGWHFICEKYNNDSGTSFAAPQVAVGMALMYAINPKLSITDGIEVLKETAQPLGGIGDEIVYGSGLLDLEALVKKAYEKK